MASSMGWNTIYFTMAAIINVILIIVAANMATAEITPCLFIRNYSFNL